VLIGPHAHVNGAEIGDEALVATGDLRLFPARVGAGAEVSIQRVLHVNSVLPTAAALPIGWIAVGDSAQMFPPKAHDEISGDPAHPRLAGTVRGRRTAQRSDRAAPMSP